MTMIIGWRRELCSREILEIKFRIEPAMEIRMIAVDPGVDDRHNDAITAKSVRLANPKTCKRWAQGL